MNEYIDTRGVWPVYIRGNFAILLDGVARDISLKDAKAYLMLKGLL